MYEPFPDRSSRFPHSHGNEQARCKRQRRYEPDRGSHAQEVGGDPGEQRSNRITQVAPETVHADGSGPPGRVGDIANSGEQRRIHHCRPEAQQNGTAGESRESP
jgi:hypothetical protein